MKHLPLFISGAVAVGMIAIGLGSDALMTDLALLVGGVFAGHVLTELLNDPDD